MRKLLLTRTTPLLLLAGAAGLAACNKEIVGPPGSGTTAPAPTTPAPGTAMVRTGTMQPQGGVPSSGTVSIERDANGAELVRFAANFRTDFHTGSLGVYLAKSDALVRVQRAADPANVLRVGTIVVDGAQTLPITGGSAGYTHVIIHCDLAMYNFGAALVR
ncbi:hypothetical protein IC235_06875 [Hymenobacter sp. BT664]|uniref:DM13 domain-containing protein n=1 Tax=Hymenobacter montanus TaxID=2771359 RepID=A0A927BCM1_9BACT|nr:hypothetical protein [Hymenobacter montanus]MBD2767612.1 hypothetical protein [Hymenobacter montanus]